jgi:hexokinase
LALDLGGTNFRVLLITLDGQSFDMKSKIYAIPQSLMLGTGKQLFDHIAQCLALFVKDLKLEKEILPLGFTFSFPLTQQGLTKGLLVRWTKGFNCSGVVDEDVVGLLEEAIARRNVRAFINLRIHAILKLAYTRLLFAALALQSSIDFAKIDLPTSSRTVFRLFCLSN